MMHSTPSRRQVLALAGFKTLGILTGCTSSSGSATSGLSIGMNRDAGLLQCKSSDAAAVTPLGGSLEKTGSKKITLVYSGSYLGSKESGQAGSVLSTLDAHNQRTAPLKTTVTYFADRLNHYSMQMAQTLKGVPTTGGNFMGISLKLPPFVGLHSAFTSMGVPLHFAEAPPFFGVQIDQNTGVGAPEIAFSGSMGESTFKLRPVGRQFVAATGQTVNTWSWERVVRGSNAGGQSMVTAYDAVLSTQVPGQLISYSYTHQVAGLMTESSSGSLVSIG